MIAGRTRYDKRGSQLADRSIPEQVHIALGRDQSEMVVIWATAGPSSSLVSYGLSPETLDDRAEGESVEFGWTEGNAKGLHYLHRATLTVSP